MPNNLRVDQLAAKCAALQSEMDFTYKSVAPSIEFSNTGRRGGKKYFSISLIELLITLQDIETHISKYVSSSDYNERVMRDLFSETLSSNTVNALSTVQTLPLFALINKFIYVANDLQIPFDEKKLNISAELVAGAIDYLCSQLPDDESYLESLSNPSESDLASPSDDALCAVGENIIFYGAPGTGKSYTIDRKCTEINSIRTVFHPETQSSDFFGCLKPGMDGNDIVYSFRPGPFCLALQLAHEKQDADVFLVIEEINRAAAAAVFGELFQLLDRTPSGESQYSITVSDPDMLQYLEDNASSVLSGKRLKIPKNLNLYATMNSSDQAVMPMDTAFKRRWKFDYIPIDFEKPNAGPSGTIPITFSDGSTLDVPWRVFAYSVNKLLEIENIPEDRLLGPWFLSDSEVVDSATALRSLKGKVLLYLWDDVLRHSDKKLLFAGQINTFSSLIRQLDSNKAIFSKKVEELIAARLPAELVDASIDIDDEGSLVKKSESSDSSNQQES